MANQSPDGEKDGEISDEEEDTDLGRVLCGPRRTPIAMVEWASRLQTQTHTEIHTTVSL